VNLKVSNPAQEIELSIFDMVGHQVMTRTYNVEPGSNSQTINIPTETVMPAGMYSVVASTGGKQFMEKLVVR